MKTEFQLGLIEGYLGDIYGLVDTTTNNKVKKGLLEQSLRLSTKQHLKILARELSKEKTTFEETLKEVKGKYFDGDNLKEGMNTEDLIKEIQELSETKVSINHFDFTSVDDISNLVCQEDYSLIEKIVPVE